MVPLTILNSSLTTLATGARQFVVQEAFEIMWCFAASYFSWFTPSTSVMSSFFAGAEMITFFTVPRMCFLASLASVKCPVDSTTTCAPTDSQGSAPGSRSLNTLMVLPSIVMLSAPGGNLVREIAENRVVLQQMGQSLRIRQIVDRDDIDVRILQRSAKTLRPMRPKPLMPTLIAIFPPEIYEGVIRFG